MTRATEWQSTLTMADTLVCFFDRSSTKMGLHFLVSIFHNNFRETPQLPFPFNTTSSSKASSTTTMAIMPFGVILDSFLRKKETASLQVTIFVEVTLCECTSKPSKLSLVSTGVAKASHHYDGNCSSNISSERNASKISIFISMVLSLCTPCNTCIRTSSWTRRL